MAIQTAIQIEQHLQDIEEMFFALTKNAATKVGVNSTLEGIMYAIAKTGQMVNKDVLNLIADNNIDLAFGSQLDDIALKNGYGVRYGATGSSTYIFLYATSGTTYLANTHQFISLSGEIFALSEDVTIPSNIEFVYAKINSLNQSANTNVPANSITRMNVSLSGHKSCWNDFIATGGRDIENDTDFRNRIKQILNIFAIGTLAQLEQTFNKINNRVLRVYKGGYDNITGRLMLYVSTVNGVDLNNIEIDNILIQSEIFLSMTEQKTGITILPINYIPLNIEIWLDLVSGADISQFRTNLQKAFQRKYDYRYLNYGDVISRLELMLITQRMNGVKRVLDTKFTINGITQDIIISELQLPRFKSFVLRDLSGTIISDNTINTDYQMFFQSITNADFQTIVSNI